MYKRILVIIMFVLPLISGCVQKQLQPEWTKEYKSLSAEEEFTLLSTVDKEIAQKILELRTIFKPGSLDTKMVIELADYYIEIAEIIQHSENPYFIYSANRGLTILDWHAKGGGARTSEFKARVGVLKLMLNRPRSAISYFRDAFSVNSELKLQYEPYLNLANFFAETNSVRPYATKYERCDLKKYSWFFINSTQEVYFICKDSVYYSGGLRLGDIRLGNLTDKDTCDYYFKVKRRGKIIDVGPFYTSFGITGRDVDGQVVISEIQRGCYADKFGVKPGDHMTHINGVKITGPNMWRYHWIYSESDVFIDLIRDGQIVNLKVEK